MWKKLILFKQLETIKFISKKFNRRYRNRKYNKKYNVQEEA